MKSNYKKIGDYIQLVDERNRDLAISKLLGINITKNYMPSVANQTDLDLSKYKIVRKGRFACNIMHVGRDERLPVSLYSEDKPALVSPAYITFEVLDSNILLPEYLMMVFQKSEFDRYSWYVSDSSVRGGLEWERFCEIEIPIPDDIEVQKNVVAVYNELLRNQKSHEGSLADLQLVSNGAISSVISKSDEDKIRNLVRLVDTRNTELFFDEVLGINIDKKFIKSVANTSETDISKYKVIQKNQFAYSAMQVGRDETIRVALFGSDKPAIISPAYLIFEVVDIEKVLPEYLMMCFQRPESDRYGWFISDGSVRSSLEWERFSEIEIPLPDIEVQKLIVAIHHVLESRKKINEDLKNMITPLCPVLMKGVVDALALSKI
jgi:type I restriction enzyme, S subunit